jgi:predicted transcriptional regulator
VFQLETIFSRTKYPRYSNRRDRISIIADILSEAKTASNKTRIMCRCNLNYKQIELYTEMLMEKKLLKRKNDNEGKEKFVTTAKGNSFTKNFQKLQALILEKNIQPLT